MSDLNIDAEILSEPEPETWVFNETGITVARQYQDTRFNVNFVSNGTNFTMMMSGEVYGIVIVYKEDENHSYEAYRNGWKDEAYRTITFNEPVDLTSEFGI